MATLKFLGTDSGFGTKNNSAYFEENDKLILIDCGFTVFNEIKSKLDFNKYSEINIIITHLHNDHAGSLSQVILYAWFIYNKKINVISKCEHIKEYLEITGTTKEAYDIKTDLPELEFIKTTHVAELDSYGFKIKLNNKNIVYTGDTQTLEPFLPYLAEANELYTDASKFGGVHPKIDDIINTLQELANLTVFLMHLDDEIYIKNSVNDKFNFASNLII